MNLQKNGMNGQERKEWEALCRQYNVDSLYEAIQGCREELEFLIHCAERLEPHTEAVPGRGSFVVGSRPSV